jgi:hypothetical protein
VGNGEKMRFSPRTHTADVRNRGQTYGLSLHGGPTHPNPDVRSLCDRETLFSPKCPIAYVFFDLGLYSGIRTNRRFSTDLKNPDLLEFSEMRIDPGEF